MKPSKKQIEYLKALCERKGVEYSSPTSMADASGKIKELKSLSDKGVSDRNYGRSTGLRGYR